MAEKNPERMVVSSRSWQKKNPGAVAAMLARRKAVKLKATPAWADRAAIKAIYKRAAELGMHVDHTVPLQSPLVCGLHVEANLQLLSALENSKKSNRIWPDMP